MSLSLIWLCPELLMSCRTWPIKKSVTTLAQWWAELMILSMQPHADCPWLLTTRDSRIISATGLFISRIWSRIWLLQINIQRLNITIKSLFTSNFKFFYPSLQPTLLFFWILNCHLSLEIEKYNNHKILISSVTTKSRKFKIFSFLLTFLVKIFWWGKFQPIVSRKDLLNFARRRWIYWKRTSEIYGRVKFREKAQVY